MQTSNRQAAEAGAQKVHSGAEPGGMYSPCPAAHLIMIYCLALVLCIFPSLLHLSQRCERWRSGWYLAVSPAGRMLLTRIHRSVCHSLTYSMHQRVPCVKAATLTSTPN